MTSAITLSATPKDIFYKLNIIEILLVKFITLKIECFHLSTKFLLLCDTCWLLTATLTIPSKCKNVAWANDNTCSNNWNSILHDFPTTTVLYRNAFIPLVTNILFICFFWKMWCLSGAATFQKHCVHLCYLFVTL